MFTEGRMAKWAEALRAAPPKVPVVVASLTRTNAIKYAWSIYRVRAANHADAIAAQ